jgi:hypothetical protein
MPLFYQKVLLSYSGREKSKLKTVLHNSRIARTDMFPHTCGELAESIIKAFLNPVCLLVEALAKSGAEQARNRLKEIKLLSNM